LYLGILNLTQNLTHSSLNHQFKASELVFIKISLCVFNTHIVIDELPKLEYSNLGIVNLYLLLARYKLNNKILYMNSIDISSNSIDELKSSSQTVAAVLKNLANPNRLLILCLLSQGESSVGELGALVEIGQSPLSQHLARLRAEKLVTTRKESQTVYYSIADPKIEKIIETLHSIYC